MLIIPCTNQARHPEQSLYEAEPSGGPNRRQSVRSSGGANRGSHGESNGGGSKGGANVGVDGQPLGGLVGLAGRRPPLRRFALLAVCMVFGLSASGLSLAATTVDIAPCAALPDAGKRLECFDALSREALPAQSLLPAPVPARPDPASPLAERPKSLGEGTLLERQWDLLPDQQRGSLSLSPYRTIYFMVRETSRINSQPTSPSLGLGYADSQDFNHQEAKMQLSFKAKIWEQPFGTAGNVWFGYTQQSFWQAGNHADSSPFRDNVYEPEIIGTYPLNLEIGGLKLRMVGLSLNHQSNGEAKPLSRSWNRAIGTLGMETGPWTINLRGWKRIASDESDDDNPNISNNIGRAEIAATRTWGKYITTFTARHSLKTEGGGRGAAQFDLAAPLSGQLMWHVQAFTGYGETLIDYNVRQTSVGVGLSYGDPR
ncbi:MAG: Phospholipase [Rhizobacter sp.]|nr:Phospholipase [Rhizobacter sp.]